MVCSGGESLIHHTSQMFLNEPKPLDLKSLPTTLQKTAINHGFDGTCMDKVFHVIDDHLFIESDEHGYGLTLSIDLEEKYPRFFADQDVGCNDDAFITGSSLIPVPFNPENYDNLVVTYLYPDVELCDWSDLTWF